MGRGSSRHVYRREAVRKAYSYSQDISLLTLDLDF